MKKNADVPLVYNLFQRLVGSMPAWRRHLDRIASMGFNWVFLNPFHQTGLSGSLYAVRDYYCFADIFIGPGEKTPEEQLQSFIEEAHAQGLRVMMDLVINHTAVDSPLTVDHPEWYMRDDEGGIRHPGALRDDEWVEWGDLAEIDNESAPDREKLWNYWVRLARHYASLGVDGYRCDAAYQVPAKLWEFLIGEHRKRFPESAWFAETLGCEVEETLATARAGFDYIFNSLKWWDYREDWALKQNGKLQGRARSVGFPESHDTERLAEELDGDREAVKQRMYFTAFTATGWMIPLGFEWGFRKPCDVVNAAPEDFEEPRYDLTGEIRAALALKSEHPVLREDCPMAEVPADNRHVTVLHRRSLDRSQEALLLVNTDPRKEQAVQVEPGSPFTDRGRAKDRSPEAGGEVPEGDRWRLRLAPAGLKLYIVNH